MYDRYPDDNVICPHCGNSVGWEFVDLDMKLGPINCHHCNKAFTLVPDGTITVEDTGRVNLEGTLPVLEKGETVLLNNEEHPWHNEIALICDKKHKHYRLEIRGKRLWVPENWVKINESLADSD
jgi:hypothetical protein